MAAPALETYRAEQLVTVRAEFKAARERFDSAKTRSAKRDAAEDLEFWGNKLAFLEHAR